MHTPKSIALDQLLNNLEKNLNHYKLNSPDYKILSLAKFSVTAILIASNLARLLNDYDRKILDSEKYWFEGGRQHHDVFVGGDWEIIYSDYSKLVEYITKYNQDNEN